MYITTVHITISDVIISIPHLTSAFLAMLVGNPKILARSYKDKALAGLVGIPKATLPNDLTIIQFIIDHDHNLFAFWVFTCPTTGDIPTDSYGCLRYTQAAT